MNPLKELERQGQAVWLDFITRSLLKDGSLEKMIENDGLRGVTSNPTIFQKAIQGSTDYDASIGELSRKGLSAPQVFEALAVEDIQGACDRFTGVFRKTGGTDGFVSLEVNPHLAMDAKGTLEEARHLWKAVSRPNLMIKIPATLAGLPAITGALAEGLNVNVTLIFSLERYQAVLDAWQAGLEAAAKAGRDLGKIHSVASFFISRLDSLLDGEIEAKLKSTSAADRPLLEGLLGKAAIANARAAYRLFQETIQAPRYKELSRKGAKVQRPLWASTSTKNPRYRDVIYVEELIDRDTVNTLPPATIDAFRDHGKVRASLMEGNPKEVLAALEKAGFSLKDATRKLELDGVKSFSDSYDSLLKTISDKRQALVSPGK